MCLGSVMQNAGAAEATRAMNDTLKKAMARNQAYESEAQGVLGPSIAGSSVEEANREIQAGTDKSLQGYAKVRDIPMSTKEPGGVAMQPSAKRSDAWADLMGALHAPVTGYNQFTLDQQIKNLRTAQQLGVISQLARSQAQVLPFNLSDAQHSGDSWNEWGGIVNSAEGLGMQAASMGMA